MRRIAGHFRFSASDLMRFKGCRHATALDLRLIEVGDIAPGEDSDEAALLQAQGDAHELAFLDRLRAEGKTIVEIPKDGLALEASVDLTRAAMRDGPDVIFQGALLGGAWGGYSDFLERIATPSGLGEYSYEVIDTKLKRSPDPKHVLQLSLYSDLIAEEQRLAPAHAHLELGDGSRFSIRLVDVSAYARYARGRFEDFLVARPATRANPVGACKLCRWQGHCVDEWDRADSLALIAGASRSQREKIEDAGIATMSALGAHTDRIARLAAPTVLRLQTQARLQSDRRAGGSPSFELRNPEPGRGFALLPEPDDGDLFYDIEGDPYYPGGLEYLHGVWYRDARDWRFRAFWAHDRQAEGELVAELLAFLVDHLQRHPRAHIYHYANYEIAALRRLTADHRVGEAAIDQLQRERRFVDLHKVVSGALIASEPGYSIKDLEAFYMEKRDADVATAGASVVFYERWRQAPEPEILQKIEDYNRTDCVSTQLLRDWLVTKARPVGIPWPVLAPVADGGALANVAAEDAEAAALRARLAPVAMRLGADIAELLFDLNYFHKREDKPAWWAIFDRLAADGDELIDDLECIAGLEAVGPPVQVTAQSFERTYRFPAQETKLRGGKKPCIKPADMPEGIDLRSVDIASNTLVLRRSKAKGPLPDSLHLLPPQPLRNTILRDSIRCVTEALIAGSTRHRAIEDLLARRAPRLAGREAGPIIAVDADIVRSTCDAIASMDETTLPIQGPPGTGKTFVSAASIVELVSAGKRVAVSSHSHKAIENLLGAIAKRAREEQVRCSVVKKASGDEDDRIDPMITLVTDNDAPEISRASVVGATAWHFARYAAPSFDYLVVDEAGQVSLANIVAMSRAARNIVLVGDPMQLPQPLQGVHPGRSGESALEYLIDGHRVVPADRGIFMPVSRRMHPDVCGFISDAVYEARLTCDNGAGSQTLTKPDGVSLTGAYLESVPHHGRSQVCPEEVAAIDQMIKYLTGSTYRDRDGKTRVLGRGDFLVVAPYNAQVNALTAALPGVRVGTVDRFQGQEAPICLVSMTTSSGDELPRDIEFLFSLNRINVAVSRAQVLAIVFANPALLEVPCRTVEEMQLVNTLCRLREHGEELNNRI